MLWVLGSDRPKADTLSLARWVRAGGAECVDLRVAFLSEPTGFSTPELSDRRTADAVGIADAFESAGARVVRWPFPGVSAPVALRRARRFIEQHRIQVVHSKLLRADLFVRLLRGGNPRWRWVTTASGIGAWRRTRLYGGDWLDRWVYRHTDHVVAVSAATADDWSQRLRRPSSDFTTIHHAAPQVAVLAGTRSASRRRLGLEPVDRLVLTLARLDHEKGIETLIDAVGLLRTRPHVRFVVVGDGPLRASLEHRIAATGVGGQFLLAGHSADVWSWLAAADLFVLPSRMDACPNALLEAAASGLPIVATGVGGMPEIVRDGEEALLVDAGGGAAALADAIGRALDDSALAARLGDAARERARTVFAPTLVAERYADMYRRLVGLETLR